MLFSWDAFLARYGPMARTLARSLARPPTSADDLVQEALLALHRALQRDAGRFTAPEHARNYFLRAIRNLALKSRRSAGRERPLADELPATDPSDPAARAVHERHETLARCLRDLNESDRELLVRRFHDGHTLQRIARERGIPLSTLHDREKALLAELRRRCARLTDARDQEAAG